MTLVITALFFMACGFSLGIFFFGVYVNKYFSENPYEIRWKGKTYVLSDKPDIDDSDTFQSV